MSAAEKGKRTASDGAPRVIAAKLVRGVGSSSAAWLRSWHTQTPGDSGDVYHLSLGDDRTLRVQRCDAKGDVRKEHGAVMLVPFEGVQYFEVES